MSTALFTVSVVSAVVPTAVVVPAASRYTKNEAGEYVCPSCDKKCVKQSTMFYHIEQKHGDTPSHTCDLCDKGFVQRSSWLRHLATNHPESPHPEGAENPYATQRFSCTACDREPMRTKQQLYVHYVRSHCKDVPAFVKNEPCSRCAVQHKSTGAYLYHVPKCFGVQIDVTPCDSKTTPTIKA